MPVRLHHIVVDVCDLRAGPVLGRRRWLALLLIRIIETTAGDTWNNIRRHLDRLHLGTLTGPAGTFRQRTELTKPQRDLLAKLAITPPKQTIGLEPA